MDLAFEEKTCWTNKCLYTYLNTHTSFVCVPASCFLAALCPALLRQLTAQMRLIHTDQSFLSSIPCRCVFLCKTCVCVCVCVCVCAACLRDLCRRACVRMHLSVWWHISGRLIPSRCCRSPCVRFRMQERGRSEGGVEAIGAAIVWRQTSV